MQIHAWVQRAEGKKKTAIRPQTWAFRVWERPRRWACLLGLLGWPGCGLGLCCFMPAKMDLPLGLKIGPPFGLQLGLENGPRIKIK